jgi:amino acid permease
MTNKQNLKVTFVLIIINTAFAMLIGTIGDAMTLVGSTINPIIGFVLPICFWYPFMKHEPWHSKDKILSALAGGIIVISSFLSLIEFFSSIGDSPSPFSC